MSVVRELPRRGSATRGYYRTFDQATVAAVGAVADELRLLKTGLRLPWDTGSYAGAHAQLWVPPEVGEALTTWLASSASAPQTGSMSAR